MKCVCLIDDDDVHNFTCKLFINKIFPDLKIICFSNPVKAYQQLANGVIKSNNLILLDLQMPEMNGWKFLDQCISLNMYPPTIILTSYDISFIESKAKSYSNVKSILSKPFTKEHAYLLEEYL